MEFSGMFSRLKSQYDKVIAFVVLTVLLCSLLYLALRVGMIKSMQGEFDRKIRNKKIVHESAEPVDVVPYQMALRDFLQPVQLTVRTNAMFIPETRAWCVDCRQPIPVQIAIDQGKCIFCNAVQPPPETATKTFDGDGDGIPDWWEREHGLDPRDPEDALKDPDGDGFSSLEEHLADPQTDPNDPESHPPIITKLRVVRVDADLFLLRFMSVMKLPDETLRFGLNLRQGEKTYYKRLNEEVEGFLLKNYKEVLVRKVLPGSTLPRTVDESTLTLQRGDKEVVLVKGVDQQWDEFVAHMNFSVDNTNYTVRERDVIELLGKKYTVKRIDKNEETVVITSQSDGKDLTVRRYVGSISENPGDKPASEQ